MRRKDSYKIKIKKIAYDFIREYITESGWHEPAVEDPHIKTYEMGYGIINAARAMLAISCGDVNDDLLINMLDIDYLILFFYKAGPAPTPNVRLADVDCNGIWNLLNITYLIEYLYKEGPPPSICYKF